MSETSPAEDHTAVQPASRRPPREIKRPTPTGDPAQNGESPSAEGPGQAAVSRAGSETGLIDYAVPGGRAIRDRPLVGLDARSISAWFGDHKVLERVSLRMELGLVTALIGPSGCGKSTFLRILNRMHEMISGAALAGQVLLGDDDIYDPAQRASDVRRRIGMVFQKPNPFPAMSIYDNVASGLKLAGIRVPDKNYVVESSLRRAGLWGEVQRRLRMPGGALSGGQQQRLCIARSLAPPHRGNDRRAAQRGHGGDRDPQHAASAAGLGQLRVLPGQRGHPGAHRRVRYHHPAVRAPSGPEDRRLRERPVRLSLVQPNRP